MIIIMKSVVSLHVINLSKKFGSKTILHDISMNFEQGKTYALMGASGSGKSTLLHLLAGFDVPTQGSVLLKKDALERISAEQGRYFISTVFQTPFLIRELSVFENVALAGTLHNLTAQETQTRALSLLHQVGLASYQNVAVGQLSGGQQQRVCLARALMIKPAFLLADELTGNLDHVTARDIMKLLLRLQKEWNMGIILTTHNVEIAQMMELVFAIKDGTLVANMNTEGSFHEPICRP